MKISSLYGLILAAGGLCIGSVANAAGERGPGWEFGADLIYQLSKDIDFNGGSKASLDDDLGIAIAFGYRFNNKLELQFYLDWNDVDYNASLVTFSNTTPAVPLGTVDVRGTVETFAPRAAVNYNFLEGPITPYITAGLGWAFIDTNIPTGRPQNVCWWDPWWGYVCGTVQDTKSIDGFLYDLGLGVRWDFSPGLSMRAGYERHWIDLSQADGTPGLDQFRLGIVYRY